MTALFPDTAVVAAAQRRAVLALSAAQVLGGLGFAIGIAATPLLAFALTGSEAVAGLAQTSQVMGAAAASYALARLMGRAGRRTGLVTGLLAGAAGSLLLVAAAVLGSLALLVAGAFLLGSTTAAGLGARFAATDLAAEGSQARALSTVVWATTIGAVAGPNLTGPGAALAGRFGFPPLAGPLALGALGILAAAAALALFLRPDPLLLARRLAAASLAGSAGPSGHAAPPARPRVLDVVRARPVVGVAIAGLAAAHAVMVAVMVMTPVHMEHGGATLRVIGVVISLHILGMFGFSPLVGWLVDRIGGAPVLVTGGLVLAAALVLSGLAPAGSSWLITAGLFLLGLGWSFATVSASALVAANAPLEARTEVQGTADLLMSLTAAVAGALSGAIVGGLGFGYLAGFAGLFAAGVVLAGVAGKVRP